MAQQKNQRQAMLLGLSAVLLWSTVATAFKLSLEHLTPFQLLTIASTVSLLLLLGVTSFKKQWAEVAATWRTEGRRYLLLGAINPFLYYAVLFQAYDLLPAQQAMALNYTWALTLSLLAVPLLKQPLRRYDVVALLLGYLGVLVIATDGNLLALEFSNSFGVLLALISTVLWALYWVFNARSQASSTAGLLLCFMVGTPIIWLITAFTDGFVMPWQGLAGGIYVGLFEMGLTFILWMGAMKQATHTSRVSNLIFLSPFISLILVSQLVGESIAAATYVGLVLIISAVVYQQLAARRQSQHASTA